MFLRALNKAGDLVLAADAVRRAPYFCPSCKEPVTLKRGSKRIGHFAHWVKSECKHGAGESLAHLEAKQAMFQAFADRDLDARIEHQYETQTGLRRADVLISGPLSKYKYALEVHRTSDSASALVARSRADAEIGVRTVWVPMLRPRLEEALDCLGVGEAIPRVRLNEVERELFDFLGQVGFWSPSRKAVVFLESCAAWTFIEYRDFYDREIEQEVSFGGHFTKLVAERTVYFLGAREPNEVRIAKHGVLGLGLFRSVLREVSWPGNSEAKLVSATQLPSIVCPSKPELP